MDMKDFFDEYQMSEFPEKEMRQNRHSRKWLYIYCNLVNMVKQTCFKTESIKRCKAFELFGLTITLSI